MKPAANAASRYENMKQAILEDETESLVSQSVAQQPFYMLPEEAKIPEPSPADFVATAQMEDTLDNENFT